MCYHSLPKWVSIWEHCLSPHGHIYLSPLLFIISYLHRPFFFINTSCILLIFFLQVSETQIETNTLLNLCLIFNHYFILSFSFQPFNFISIIHPHKSNHSHLFNMYCYQPILLQKRIIILCALYKSICLTLLEVGIIVLGSIHVNSPSRPLP